VNRHRGRRKLLDLVGVLLLLGFMAGFPIALVLAATA